MFVRASVPSSESSVHCVCVRFSQQNCTVMVQAVLSLSVWAAVRPQADVDLDSNSIEIMNTYLGVIERACHS